MKNTIRTEESNNRIIEYLTQAAEHGGYYFDGIKIEPGTAVTCFKTIASQTNLSYYRVKKCIDQLVESGRVVIVRHKGFAIISFCVTPQLEVHEDAKDNVKEAAVDCEAQIEETMPSNVSELFTPVAESLPSFEVSSTNPTPPFLNRAARRRLARQEAKAAARRTKHGRVGV